MPDLARVVAGASVGDAVDDQSGTDAGAHVEGGQRGRALHRAGPLLTQCRRRGVVVEHHRQRGDLLQHLVQREVLPLPHRWRGEADARGGAQRSRGHQADAQYPLRLHADAVDQGGDLTRDAGHHDRWLVGARTRPRDPGYHRTAQVGEDIGDGRRVVQVHTHGVAGRLVELEQHPTLATGRLGPHVNETVELLAVRAPKLREALRKAAREKMAYVIIDGTLIPIDRIAADRPFYSGKHKRHGVNLQVIASPDGTILWVSGELPGSTHDTAAARIWQILAALEQAGLIALGDKGYHGYDQTRQRVITPYKGRRKPQSQKDANRAHARLRGPGERANARTPNSSTGASYTQGPCQPTPHRPTGQSHPRTTKLRSHHRMKKLQC